MDGEYTVNLEAMIDRGLVPEHDSLDDVFIAALENEMEDAEQ